MVAVLCAMVASTTFIQTEFAKSSVDLQPRDGASQPVEDRTSLVETYRNAERALAAKQWRQAASLLASLIDPHNEHRLSHLCALRLADCHIKLNETNRAIQLLAKYLPQYRQSNRGDANSDREFQRGYVVLKELCQQLPNDHQSLAQLESLLESQPHSAWPDQAVELLFEKWRRQRNLKLWSDAIETGQLLRSETYAVFLTERQALSLNSFNELGVRIILLDELLANGQIEEARLKASIPSVSNSPLTVDEHPFELHFSFAELLVQHEYFQEALEQFEVLSTTLAGSSTLQERWLAPTELRIAELLVKAKEHPTAIQRIDGALMALPPGTESWRMKLQFLAARCLVADIQFQPAIERLRQIQGSPQISEEMRAKAFWYEGEVYLLTRNVKAAADAYKKALKLSSSYQARSKLQLAQCWETLGMYREAFAAYSELKSSEDEAMRLIADQHATRVAQIPEVQQR